MIKAIINVQGGLGNQLFQYAFGQSIKRKWNCEVLYNLSWYSDMGSDTPREDSLQGLFNIDLLQKESIFNKKIFRSRHVQNIFNKVTLGSRIEFRTEKDFNFSSSYQRSPIYASNVIFNGFWQSPEYFNFFCKDLKKEFSNCSQEISSFPIARKINETKNSIPIHVRRGDFVTNITTKSYHETCSIAYYEKAIQYFKKKYENTAKFFIFSDDIEWAKENIKSDNDMYFLDSSYELSDTNELFLMSMCQNHIIANSSFSWWAAWIGDHEYGTTIRPEKWYKTKTQPSTLFPKEWLSIENH